LPELAVFSTALGWMAAVIGGGRLRALRVGYATPGEAVAALGDVRATARATPSPEARRIIAALKQYARSGGQVLDELPIDLGPQPAFAARVLAECRRIPYGQTRSYGELAAAAGLPRAARAVGNVMASNRLPLVVPCHRVVGSGGSLGNYSGPGGLELKVRLLALEGARIVDGGAAPRRPG
jgi:methylated-DNA-[protein]-cysteine S-methyltransferase